MSDVDDLCALAARLRAAADAERSGIEGELHDGVQQDLVALAVNLELALQLTDSDLTAARVLLLEMRQDVQASLDAVRVVAHSVYPAILPHRGLADALRTIAAPVETTMLERYPLVIEEAVYFCCIALLRHANADATVRVWQAEGTLCFAITGEIVDDTDLSVVRDRVAALGGSLTTSAIETLGVIPL